MKLFILAIVAFSASMASAMTSEEYEDIRHEFFSQIKKNFKNNDCAKVLRLTFHDCVGGCDGCINIDNPHNAGLQDAIDVVEDVYQVVESDGIVVSRADLWAICGRAAAEYGMEGMPGREDFDGDWEEAIANFVSPFSTFKYGREDCETAPYTTDVHEFPTAHFNHEEVFDFFAKDFGFDENQTVIIMGGHTYGSMKLANSGYHGPWVLQDGREIFDNAYFVNLIADYSVFNGVVSWKNLSENNSKCRTISLAFYTNFCPIQTDLSGNTV